MIRLTKEEATEREPNVQNNDAIQSAERRGEPSPDVDHINTDEAQHAPRAEESPLPASDMPQSNDEAQSRSKSPSPVPSQTALSFSWDTLWAEAYSSLKQNEEYSQLLVEFEKSLSKRSANSGDEAGSKRPSSELKDDVSFDQIQELVRRDLEVLSNCHVSFPKVQKIIQRVSDYKATITQVVSVEPHAALAWAGITTILPMLENYFQQDEDAVEGLNNILFLLVHYRSMQESTLSDEVEDPRSLHDALLSIRDKLINLYAQVYVYQFRFHRHLERNRLHRAWRNTVTADEWKNRWAEIESMSRQIDQAIGFRKGSRLMETWKATKRIEIRQKETLGAIQDSRVDDNLSRLPFSGNATFDSAEIQSADSPCLPRTQQHILVDIQNWTEDPAGKPVLWLHGMAGTGKTSVALTVAHALKDRQPFTDGGSPPSSACLGASFFFKQGDATRNNIRSFFPTLARCLADESPALKSTIANVVRDNLSIGTKAPQQQFHHLIHRPISDLDGNDHPLHLIVVVDALDECMSLNEVRELLSLLGPLERLRNVKLRLLITSRRDPHISDSFAGLPQSLYQESELEKIRPRADGFKDDITLYLGFKLAAIAKKHHVAQDWIDKAGISQLRVKADGLFIYAATVCRFLDSEDFSDKDARQERLEYVFGDKGTPEAPQSKVDEIYIKVLSFPFLNRSLPRTKERFYDFTSKFLGIIAVLFEPLSARDLEHLFLLDRKDLRNVLKWLHAILSVPDDKEAPVGLVHLSFRDFILNQERSKQLQFHVDEAAISRHVFARCLELMSSKLRQDICKLGMPGKLFSEVQESDIRQHVPQYLRYACRYWVDHLSKLDEGELKVALRDDGEILAFLQNNVLFWIEAMSWLREIPTTIMIINRLQDLTAVSFQSPRSGAEADSRFLHLQPSTHRKLPAFIYDTNRFILGNRWIIEHAPSQLYASALLFSPETSIIRSQFHNLITPWITQEPKIEHEWTPALAVLRGHTDRVTSLKFSPTDKLAVSTALDCTIRIWDYITGTERFRFQAPSTPECAAFSHDGKLVAVQLEYSRIMVIGFSKGSITDLVVPYFGSIRVDQFTFLPKSASTLAVISSDGYLRTWDINKREDTYVRGFPIQAGVKDKAVSAISQNGAFALAALLGKLHLWSVEEKRRIQTIDIVSPHCRIELVIVSSDGKTAITAMLSGRSVLYELVLYELATGHKKVLRSDIAAAAISSIRFAGLDEKLIVISDHSGNNEVRDLLTWTKEKSFRLPGHTTIAISRDNKFIATGSRTGDIQLWDMMSIANESAREKGSSSTPYRVSFWPGRDILLLVSPYSTENHAIWDLTQSRITNHYANIKDVSPDGKFVARCSATNYVEFQLWDGELNQLLVPGDFKRIIFSPDGSRLALYQKYSGIQIVAITTLKEITVLKVHEVSTFVFSPNGKHAVLLREDNAGKGIIELWNLEKGERLASCSCSSKERPITFSQDGQLVAMLVDECDNFNNWLDRHNGIVLMEVATGRKQIIPSSGPLSTLVFRPEVGLAATLEEVDQRRVVRIVVWGTDPFCRKRVLDIGGFNCEVQSIEFLQADKLATTSRSYPENNIVQFWDLTTGFQIAKYHIDFTIDNRFLHDDPRCLESNRGRIPIPIDISLQAEGGLEQAGKDVQSCLSVGEEWVSQGVDRLLWLPPAYRTGAYAVKDKTLVIGYNYRSKDDAVRCIKFDLTRTPLLSDEWTAYNTTVL